jgi:glyoxylase I family protein
LNPLARSLFSKTEIQAMATPSPKFNHVALNCKDALALERFYTRHFGFTRARVIPLGGGQQIVFLKAGGIYLELFQAEGPSHMPLAAGDGPHGGGVRHIAFKVDDLDATLAALGDDIKARITLGKDKPLDFSAFIPNWKTVWLSDPEGNIVEISQGYVDDPNVPPLPNA